MRFFSLSISSRVGRFKLRTIGSTPFSACFSMRRDDALTAFFQILDRALGSLLQISAELLRLRQEILHCLLPVLAEELARILADPSDDALALGLDPLESALNLLEARPQPPVGLRFCHEIATSLL